MSTQYTLERTLPDGQVKTQGPTTRREAVILAGWVLTDNLGTSRYAASRVMQELGHAPDGTAVKSHGYTFRLVSDAS
jgi:hypothetical protein